LRIALDLCFLACVRLAHCTWLALLGLHSACALHLICTLWRAFGLPIALDLRFLACVRLAHCTRFVLLGLRMPLDLHFLACFGLRIAVDLHLLTCFGLRIAQDLCFLAFVRLAHCSRFVLLGLRMVLDLRFLACLRIALDLRLLTFVRLHLLTFVRLAFSLHIAPNLRFLACIWFAHCTQLALLGLHFALLGFCSGCALHSTWQVFTSKYKITYLACGTWRCGIFYISWHLQLIIWYHNGFIGIVVPNTADST
jgi:hypothetical protein